MPNVEELMKRYESACERIQDIQSRVQMIEAFMVGKESFTFNSSEQISKLGMMVFLRQKVYWQIISMQ